MSKLPILAKNYIRNVGDLEQYECRVCFEVQPTVMRCSGPCKTALCLTCATSICVATKEASCPQRCSPQLVLEPIPGLQIQFDCPYEREKCKASIAGREAFAEHCLQCEHISTEALAEHLRSDEHVCHQGHPLLFLDREVTRHFFHQMTLATLILKCAGCGEKKFCRSYCAQCSSEDHHVAFCHECRALPCTKEICPNGHHFLEKRPTEPKYYCDMCSQCIYFISDHCYVDATCDLGFCMPCYERLPESHPLVPLEANAAHWQKHEKPLVGFNALNYANLPVNHHFGLMPHNYLGAMNHQFENSSESEEQEQEQEQEQEEPEEQEEAEEAAQHQQEDEANQDSEASIPFSDQQDNFEQVYLGQHQDQFEGEEFDDVHNDFEYDGENW